MGRIKLKFLTVVVFMFVIIGLFSILLPKTCKAEEQVGVYIVGEPTYRLTNSIVKKDKVIGHTYQINITLHNSENTRSEDLTVNLTDETGSLHKNTFLEPGETQIISFTWSTINIKNQRLTVNFYPSDVNANWNQYNSGSKTFTIKIDDESDLPATSTPGFEVILVITAIILSAFLWKKKE